MVKIILGTVLLTVLVSCTGDAQQPPSENSAARAADEADQAITLTSAAFVDSVLIPVIYTCDSIDISPPLHWAGVPDSAQSLALIVEDPDAPGRTWVHWVVYNIPPDTNGFDAHVPADTLLTNGSIQGISDFKRIGYGGPCPPGGTHRYVFKLYALDAMLEMGAGATKLQLLKAMDGHIIAQGQLVGLYARRK